MNLLVGNSAAETYMRPVRSATDDRILSWDGGLGGGGCPVCFGRPTWSPSKSQIGKKKHAAAPHQILMARLMKPRSQGLSSGMIGAGWSKTVDHTSRMMVRKNDHQASYAWAGEHTRSPPPFSHITCACLRATIFKQFTSFSTGMKSDLPTTCSSGSKKIMSKKPRPDKLETVWLGVDCCSLLLEWARKKRSCSRWFQNGWTGSTGARVKATSTASLIVSSQLFSSHATIKCGEKFTRVDRVG